jgi:hypothetical protein
VAGLFRALEVAADGDGAASGLLEESRLQRLVGARAVVKRLAALDALTDAVSRADAADVAWLATDPMLFDRFVRIRGWSVGKFETWLTRTLTGQLLSPWGLAGGSRLLGTRGVPVPHFSGRLLRLLRARVQCVGAFPLGIQMLARGIHVVAVGGGPVLQAGRLGGFGLGFGLGGTCLRLRLGGDGLPLVQAFALLVHVFSDVVGLHAVPTLIGRTCDECEQHDDQHCDDGDDDPGGGSHDGSFGWVARQPY